MEEELKGVLEGCGLPVRWLGIFQELDISSIDNLQQNLHTQSVLDELKRQETDGDKEALHILLNLCTLYNDEPTPNGSQELPQLPERNFTNTEKDMKLDQVLLRQDLKDQEEAKSPQSDEKIFQNQKRFLMDLGLFRYFPEKITLEMVMGWSCVSLDSLNDIPWSVLGKILMLDYRGRDDVVPSHMKNAVEVQAHAVSVYNDLEDPFSQIFDTLESETCISHPSDVLVASIRCCSNFLRQMLCEKMFTCKLSIPLLLPPFLGKEQMLLLWSLRSINLECISSEGQHNLVSAVNHTLPVVSFARLGEISRSKSKFLNEMVNNQSHSTFFNRDCENGRNKRKISDGVIEMAWRLNSVKTVSSENCNNNVLFLNLRGNGNYHRKSINFMFSISDVVVLMIDANEIENALFIFGEIAPSDGQYMFMVTKQPNFLFTKDHMEKMKSCLNTLRHSGLKIIGVVLDFDGKGKKNIKALKEEVEHKLDRYMSNCNKAPIGNFEAIAKSFDFTVDCNDSSCKFGEKGALDIIQTMKKQQPHSSKSTHLPLQCQPWKRWAALNKEEHRGEKRGNHCFDEYTSHIYSEKNEKRNEQLRLLERSTDTFKRFLHYMLNSTCKQRLYFLKWLKIYLDDISREILPSLQRDCNSKWDEIRLYDERKDQLGILDRRKYNNLQHDLQQFEIKLDEYSFGLEHFMREIAQAFEAVSSVTGASQKLMKKVSGFPKIMAELMLYGYPLELMDGDAAHIPLKWVSDVLCELHNIIEDKKIFVLSVLGVQSSGKSTLLNTMFGLKFNVAAGRCTRGVYAQLVSVPQKYHKSKYDFILVLDTEGLRAPELGEKKIQHDNEIATLVIGLGDVTLVNIKGENVSEIEDVLQIVIHALLKMKLVNKSIALQPSCFFIHQNVPAVDAAQQLKTGQRKFIETLDKVTKAAGKQEDAPQFTKFSQLIDFDINQNVSYFSDLWKGNPPSAPANPGYSENVREVKERLLGDIMYNRTTYLDIPKLSMKINDLWNGILDQNFVFSFKNSLEIETYISLESKLSDLQWVLKTTALKWFNAKTNVIGNCEELKSHMFSDMISELRCHLKEKHEEEKRNLEKYFEVDEDNVMLQQWRARSFQRLEYCYDDIISRTSEDLKREVDIKKIHSNSKKDMEKYKIKITSAAKQLAEHLRTKETNALDEEAVRNYFRQKWNSWMDNISRANHDYDIGSNIKKILIDSFHQDNALLKKNLEKLHTTSEEVIRKELDSAIEKYVVDSWTRNIIYFTSGYQKKKAKEFVSNMNEKINCLVVNTQGQPFTKEDIKVLFECCKETVNAMKSSSITIRNEKEFSIYVVICSYEFACQMHYKMYEITKFDMQMSQINDFSNHQCFEEMLKQQFSSHTFPLIEQLKRKMQRNFRYTCTVKDDLLEIEEINKDALLPHAKGIVEKFFEELESYLKKPEIQNFKEVYVEEIIMKAKNVAMSGKVKFTKSFRIQLAVRACYKALPLFRQKHKEYIENLNPRVVLERDYFETYFEMFKNTYYKIAAEEGLSKIIAERLNKAIENAVDKDMITDLADDVRNNVLQVKLKVSLLQAILQKLIEEDNYEEFLLYLNNISSCYEKWISYFVNNYLFSRPPNRPNRYTEIASLKIASVISRINEDILKTSVTSCDEQTSGDALVQWIKDFHERVADKLPLPLSDLTQLTEDYEILTLKSFTTFLSGHVKLLEKKLTQKFSENTKDHLQTAHKPNLYEVISQECKGCTERCPFCFAPCTLNTEGHVEQGIKHMVKEHYPQACGEYRWLKSGKLITENCTALVAMNKNFKCKDTEWKWHPYKDYHKIYPDWKIHGDLSVEASPYWKWFLVKYESSLAVTYDAERPDVPTTWQNITKEMACESVN